MLTSIVLVSSVILVSLAEVVPNAPGPGDSFNEGTTCHIGWAGDTDGSATVWKNMAIELMTGPGSAMITLSTVATGLDGTKAGTFDYSCPNVSPNSPIYFYQFTAAGTSNVTWTTRFTIAGTDGSSTPATKTDEQGVPYGNGKLVSAPAGSGSSSASSAASGPAKSSSTANSASQTSSGSESDAASHSTSSPTSSGPSTSATVPAIKPSKKKNLAGPIAGGVVGGLVLLSALVLGFLFCRARRRGHPNNTSLFFRGTEGALEKTGDAPRPWHPLPRNSALEPQPTMTTLPSGKTQLSLANRVPPALLAAQEKYAARQGDTEQSESAPQASWPSRPPEESTNAQLVAEVRLLREQMDAMQRERRMELPEYTPNYTDTSG